MRPRTVAMDILDVLAKVDRATTRKLAEDANCDVSSVSRALPLLLDRRLVEEAGPLPIEAGPPGRRRLLCIPPMTYRLHRRLRT